MSTLDLKWPDLAEPYASALRDAVAFVLDRVDPVGIVACGSVIRGTPSPNSDLDIYVVHEADWRQRIQRRFGGVPAEIFINPPTAIRGYFETERRAGRPITAHMLSTGFVVLDRDPVVQGLVDRGRGGPGPAAGHGPGGSVVSALSDRGSVRKRRRHAARRPGHRPAHPG